MSKCLEALEPIKKMFCPHWSLENYEIIEKSLKAFEIIKRISYYDIGFLDYVLDDGNITKEEYNLLKEVLL